jgi:hypothetical protein
MYAALIAMYGKYRQNTTMMAPAVRQDIKIQNRMCVRRRATSVEGCRV